MNSSDSLSEKVGLTWKLIEFIYINWDLVEVKAEILVICFDKEINSQKILAFREFYAGYWLKSLCVVGLFFLNCTAESSNLIPMFLRLLIFLISGPVIF